MSEDKKTTGKFRKGISGNPRGRPRKSRRQAKSILSRKIPVKFRGETIEADPRTAVWLVSLMRGLKGQRSAMDTFLSQKDIIQDFLLPSERIEKITHIITRPGTHDTALCTLDFFKDVDGVCKIEPWILKEAVRNNPGLDVSGFDRLRILEPFVNQAAAEKLLLPRGLAPES